MRHFRIEFAAALPDHRGGARGPSWINPRHQRTRSVPNRVSQVSRRRAASSSSSLAAAAAGAWNHCARDCSHRPREGSRQRGSLRPSQQGWLARRGSSEGGGEGGVPAAAARRRRVIKHSNTFRARLLRGSDNPAAEAAEAAAAADCRVSLSFQRK